MAHEWEIGLGATAIVTGDPDLRFVVETDRPGAYRIDVEELLKREILRLAEERDRLEAEHLRLEGELHASKTYAAVMAEEDKKLCLEVDRLRYAEGRLTSLRLEVDKRDERIAHLESLLQGHATNALLTEARIKAMIATEAVIGREIAHLRTDLAAAIKTGEEQAETIAALRDRRERDTATELCPFCGTGLPRLQCPRCFSTFAVADEYGRHPGQRRLSRLDALLASDEPPEGLNTALWAWEGSSAADIAWSWFREQLRGPIDDPSHQSSDEEV